MENIFHKMVFVIVIALHETKCTILQFPVPLEPQLYFPIINLRGVNQSILYYKRNNNDNLLIYSILKEAFTNQPVMLLSEKVEISIKDKVNSNNPNIILLAESLNIEDLNTETFKNLLFSYWTTLYLVITTRNKNYICNNGTLTENAFTETKNYLNKLWQIFRIAKVSLSFPYTCPMHYVIYNGKESSGTDLYNRGIILIRPKNRKEYAIDIARSGDPRDLTEGYPLKANIFYRTPTSITECDVVRQFTNIDYGYSLGFCGLDGMVMYDYIKYNKYRLNESVDEECARYGYELNNTVSGSLGCILRQELDISFNSRFIWWYSRKGYHFLHYVSHDTLCAAIKRPNRIPLWHYPINMFPIYSWIWLLLSLSLVGVVTWLKAKILVQFTGGKSSTLRFYLFNAIYSGFFGVLVKNDGKYRILKGTSLLCSIILVSVYQGHFNNQFTTRSHYPEIKSLQQLYSSSHVIYSQQSIFNFIKPIISNKNLPRVLKHIRLRNTTSIDYLLQNSINTPAATIERKRDTIIDVDYNHTDKYGKPEVYLIDMPIQMFYLSLIARDGFPFLEESEKFMMRLTEAGLPNKYYIWTGYTFSLAGGWSGTQSEPRPFKAIKVKKLRVAFGLLFIGYIISGLVFIVERWGKIPENSFCCK